MSSFTAGEIIKDLPDILWDLVSAILSRRALEKWDEEELAVFRVMKPHYIEQGRKFGLKVMPLLLDTPQICEACSALSSVVIPFVSVDLPSRCPRCFDEFLVAVEDRV
jgi:hypothetical protein